MASKEELGAKKASELQQMLDFRGLDSSGKKHELVDRLLKAMQAEVSHANGSDAKPAPASSVHDVPSADDAQVLLAQMRILKEKEVLAEQEICVRSRMEQEQLRIEARRKQLDLEEKLAKLGKPLTDAEMQSARISTDVPDRSSESTRSSHVAEALATHIQRSLLPPTEVSLFSGNIQEYRLFIKAFDTRVANKTTDQHELLSYLEQFTRGRPNRVVRNCLHLGEHGYRQARLALEREYGNSHVLIGSYVSKLRSWPRVLPGDVQGLDQLVLFLVEVQNAMTNVSMGELEHPRTLRDVVQKLPTYLRDRWLREADKVMRQGQDGTASGFVHFSDLVEFLENELRILRNPVFGAGRISVDLPDSNPRSADAHDVRNVSKHRVNAVNVNGRLSGPGGGLGSRGGPGPGGGSGSCGEPDPGGRPGSRGGPDQCGGSGLGRSGLSDGNGQPVSRDNKSRPAPSGDRLNLGGLEPSDICMYCEKDHSTDRCNQLRWKPYEERKAFVFRKRLCFGCLQPGHPARLCKARLTCGICGNRHATLLHMPPKPLDPSSSEAPPAAPNVVSAGVGLKRVRNDYTMMPVVPVRLKGTAGKEVQTNAFLDQGSSGSFITSRLVSQLGLEKEDLTITIDTVANEGQEVMSAVVEGVRVH